MSSPPPKKLRVEETHPLDLELVSVVTNEDFEDGFNTPDLFQIAEWAHFWAHSYFEVDQEELKSRALVMAESLQAFSFILKAEFQEIACTELRRIYSAIVEDCELMFRRCVARLESLTRDLVFFFDDDEAFFRRLVALEEWQSRSYIEFFEGEAWFRWHLGLLERLGRRRIHDALQKDRLIIDQWESLKDEEEDRRGIFLGFERFERSRIEGLHLEGRGFLGGAPLFSRGRGVWLASLAFGYDE